MNAPTDLTGKALRALSEYDFPALREQLREYLAKADEAAVTELCLDACIPSRNH